MTVANDREQLAQALRALKPFLGQLVLVGGWAHRLYRLHPAAATLPYEPLMTRDVDVVIPDRTPLKGGSLRERLTEAGFKPELLSDEIPPVSHYVLPDAGGFFLEFLMPATGSGVRRDGSSDSTATVSGVTAQKLRHIQILLEEPWAVCLSPTDGFPLDQDGLEVRIANPVSYLTQKLLTTHRKPASEAKDVLYIHDTLQLFAGSLDALREQWARIRLTLSRKALANLRRRSDALRLALSDPVRSASIVASKSGRSPAPGPVRIQAVLKAGLSSIYGE